MNLENEFVPYEQALALKELGFDENCFGFYGDDSKMLYKCYVNKGKVSYYTLSPTFSQAFRWFREKYNLHSWVAQWTDTKEYYYELCRYEDDKNNEFSTYEKAELECLKKLIEIVKNK